ncbi:hypothetical protein BB559_006361, partial [Furculomyces boomerangus]
FKDHYKLNHPALGSYEAVAPLSVHLMVFCVDWSAPRHSSYAIPHRTLPRGIEPIESPSNMDTAGIEPTTSDYLSQASDFAQESNPGSCELNLV